MKGVGCFQDMKFALKNVENILPFTNIYTLTKTVESFRKLKDRQQTASQYTLQRQKDDDKHYINHKKLK